MTTMRFHDQPELDQQLLDFQFAREEKPSENNPEVSSFTATTWKPELIQNNGNSNSHSSLSSLNSSYPSYPPVSNSQGSDLWSAAPAAPAGYGYDLEPLYDSPNMAGCTPEMLYPKGVSLDNMMPRTWQQQPYDPQLMAGVGNDVDRLDLYQQAPMYQLDSQSQHDYHHESSPDRYIRDYVHHENSNGLARLSISNSPPMGDRYGSPSSYESGPLEFQRPITSHPYGSTPHDGDLDIGSPPDLEEQSNEEPYAKLIYRALMSAPDKSMVLQEIYQWFIANTDKGKSQSTGWKNSIRHNLSMNAAFRKTERRVNGDENKKSTEWVLEPFAIRDGVKSTTRYRNKDKQKQNKKTDAAPAIIRQISGRKGGLKAGQTKSKLLRERDVREANLSVCTTGRRGDLDDSFSKRPAPEMMHGMDRQGPAKRQRSPPTPPGGDMEMSQPYFVRHEVSPPRHLGDVAGVYNDPDQPVFCSSNDGLPYENNLPPTWTYPSLQHY